MQTLAPLMMFAAFVAGCIFIHAMLKFHQIVWTEQPEWVTSRGIFSRSFDELPHALDPSVQTALLLVAFSSKPSLLRSPLAGVYANRYRWSCVACAFFLVLGGLATSMANAT